MNTTRILQDSLTNLLHQRLTQLTRTHGARGYAYRKPSQDIIRSEISRMIQQELKAEIYDIWGKPPKREKVEMDDDPFGDGRAVMSARRKALLPRQPKSGNGGGCIDIGKDMRLSIDQAVADILMNGPQTSNVLRVLFGLVPILTGR